MRIPVRVLRPHFYWPASFFVCLWAVPVHIVNLMEFTACNLNSLYCQDGPFMHQ